eukprot:TRINITY_DN3411_c0_g1_i1.p1 TRINITY_DN3411_c0_g1~~TRINITY_DN3411_c0_g1_i1.p1  ORF type:complete len:116 (-),score=33.76 TRINITY_DN3411_c0_g1_i1:272-571(-)
MDQQLPPSLDAKFEESFANLLSQNGVLGAIAVDKNGLCLAAKGTASRLSAGYQHNLIENATKLSKTGEHPLVVIETDTCNIFLKKQGDEGTSLGIYKVV